jgi:polyhydroxyalkanoate synthesis regulator phasin
MIELIEKTMLTGIGAISMTQKKAEELIAELRSQFNISEEKGKDLLEKVQQAARDNQKKLEELAQVEVMAACERLGLVTREEFDKVRKKVHLLEKQLKEAGK